ncbi:hypothetical protein VPNG_09821 [Cytospora leucostoma]|uniref:Uncharacterized protein n=1 Tax=Cytospora leucostoma TaxID=1230097 RepID=A0A423VM70_9PEZI|nr:hypothetical protein VPNG_09821 [Cytospora leucostoma]
MVFIGLCHSKAVQSSPPLFYFFADVLYFLFIAAGAILLLMILIKYIQTRRETNAWTWAYGTRYTRGESRAARAYHIDVETTPSSGSTLQQDQHQWQPKGIYDSWLLLRLSIAFAFLWIFESNTVIVQLTGQANMKADAVRAAPDLSAKRARRDFALLVPGSIASVLAFLTFGTTQQFRKTMYQTFVPRRWRRGPDEEDGSGASRAPPRLNIAITSAEHVGHQHEHEREARRRQPPEGLDMVGSTTGADISLEALRSPRGPSRV